MRPLTILTRGAVAVALAVIISVGCGDEDEGPAPSASGGCLWIIDQPNNVIKVYDYAGEYLMTVGNFPFFYKPNCIEVDRRDGSAWVLDYYKNILRKFDSNGNVVYETPGPTEGEPLIRRGTSIAVDQDSGACWVADRAHTRILKIGANGGVLATVNGFRSPRWVSLVPGTGDCWVTDELQDRAVKLRADVTGTVNVGAVMLAECRGFDTPWAVAADPGGGAWVTDKGTGSVVKVNSAGERKAEVAGFSYPYCVAVSDRADCVYVVDYEEDRLAAFPRGVTGISQVDEAAKLLVSGLPYPTDVEIDEDGGYVFVAASDAVRRYTSSGELLYEYTELTLPLVISVYPEP